jgi:hypothetical protein
MNGLLSKEEIMSDLFSSSGLKTDEYFIVDLRPSFSHNVLLIVYDLIKVIIEVTLLYLVPT